jgi:hypothetical protein
MLELIEALDYYRFLWPTKHDGEAFLPWRKLKFAHAVERYWKNISLAERKLKVCIQVPGKSFVLQPSGHCH